ncbi:MAG: transketolase C-terminal domain-containing protein [Erysipelotrichaceae bacterium]|nr:transketolase C-terminal domain-containing protein [Erysipelotrichaceae bacterium]
MAQETRNAYGEKLAELIVQNENIVVLDADLTKSTKTIEAKKACPDRHFNAGIAECNMLGMAAGLAASGKTVFASSFAMFAAGRAFEIIRNSIAYPRLNVKVCATHAGLSVGEDGASHQSVEDVAIMRAMPGMKVFVPCDQYETKALIEYVSKFDGPCYVRLGRGKVEDVYNADTKFDFTKVDVLRQGKDVVLFAMGLMVQEALKAAEELDATVVNVSTLKPFDEEGVLELLKSHKKAYALEEHNIIGGLYSAICEAKGKTDITTPVTPIGVMDRFGESGKAADVLEKHGLTAAHVVEVVKGN